MEYITGKEWHGVHKEDAIRIGRGGVSQVR